MKYLFFLILLNSSLQWANAQLVYLNFQSEIYTLDVETCDVSFVMDAGTEFYDISFHPNGNFYGISPNGELFESDLNTGGLSLIIDLPDGQTFNSLTSNSDGVFYIAGDGGDLWSYNLATNLTMFHGNIGFPVAGDLTFYEGELYAAANDNNIVLVDIDTPANSVIVINDMSVSDAIFGIFSFAESCSEINTYANSSEGSIYLINYEDQALEFICNVNMPIYGGASTFEFLGSSNPITLNNVDFVSPICNENNGSIIVTATNIGSNLEYAINGGTFQSSNTFSNLEAGVYEISIRNEEGCLLFEQVELIPLDFPIIEEVLLVNPDCGDGNFSVTILASGGIGDLAYSIDGTNFVPTNEFSALFEGAYTAYVVDENNCELTQDFNFQAGNPPSINNFEILPTSCGENNGILSNLAIAGGEEPFEYSIDNGLTYQDGNTFENLASGNYMLMVKDKNGCQDSGEFEILPSLSLEVNPEIKHTTCNEANGEIVLNVENAIGLLEYSLDGIAFQTSNVFFDLIASNYSIIINDEGGCTKEIMIEVLESELPNLEIGDIQIANCNENDAFIQLIASGGEPPYQYSLDSLNFQGDNLFENLAAANYNFTVKDANDCKNQLVEIVINSKPCKILIPTAFSPNNDGLNDLFRLNALDESGILIKSYHIYNRWGELVHEAQNFPLASDGFWWDGTHNNKPNLIGVYLYFIEVEFEDNSSQFFKGNLTLIR